MIGVRTQHIRFMLRQAERLAQIVDELEGPEVIDERVRDSWGFPQNVTETEIIERAVTLAQHAVAELMDERDRMRGWAT